MSSNVNCALRIDRFLPGVLFSSMVSGWLGGGKSLSGLYLRKVDLIFDLAVMTLTYKFCLGYISETVRCRKLILGGHIG